MLGNGDEVLHYDAQSPIVLEGFFSYRQALLSMGLTGAQWLDGQLPARTLRKNQGKGRHPT